MLLNNTGDHSRKFSQIIMYLVVLKIETLSYISVTIKKKNIILRVSGLICVKKLREYLDANAVKLCGLFPLNFTALYLQVCLLSVYCRWALLTTFRSNTQSTIPKQRQVLAIQNITTVQLYTLCTYYTDFIFYIYKHYSDNLYSFACNIYCIWFIFIWI